MFKQLAVSIVLGVSLLSSVVIWAQNNEEPVIMAKASDLDVANQLSISEYSKGNDSYVNQVGKPTKAASKQNSEDISVSMVAGFWVMLFALFVFVTRSSTRRL